MQFQTSSPSPVRRLPPGKARMVSFKELAGDDDMKEEEDDANGNEMEENWGFDMDLESPDDDAGA